MLYFHMMPDFSIDQVSTDGKMIHGLSDDGTQWVRRANGTWGAGWFNRNDFDKQHFDKVEELAANASRGLGKLYIAVDSGPSVSPRFDIILAPAVGDECSKHFNGDSYPVGKIVSITPKTMRCIIVEGPRGRLKFWRDVQSARWVLTGGTWGLIPGIRNDFNREF